MIDVAGIRKAVQDCETRYRFSSAIGHVCGFGSPECGRVIALVNWLREQPEKAEREGRHQQETFSAEAASLRRGSIWGIIQVLEVVEHDAPPPLMQALTTYCAALWPQVSLTLADGERREAMVYPNGEYVCPFCAGVVVSPDGHEYRQRLNAENYARRREVYEPSAYGHWERRAWEARGCPNPACMVNMTADRLAAARRRLAEAEAERDRQRRISGWNREYARQSQEREDQLWAERRAEAEGRGACLECLRRSYWQSRPKFVKHRHPANCPHAPDSSRLSSVQVFGRKDTATG